MKTQFDKGNFFWFCLVLTLMLSCKQAEEKVKDNLFIAAKSSVVPDPLSRYWDSFNFADTLAMQKPETGEQALVNFIGQLSTVSDSVSSKAIKNMLSRVRPIPASFAYFTKQYEHYLYDPNSPLRNDGYYQPVLEFLIDSCKLSEADQYRYQERLSLVRKNQLGTTAFDFDFQTADGAITNLSKVNGTFVMLMFYEPGCPNCDTAIDELKNSTGFRQLVEKGILNIVTIYPHGNPDIWKAYQSHIPANWINGFDKTLQVKTKRLYDIKASPTIYLLDDEKKVLLKDTDLNQVATFFNSKESTNTNKI